MKSIPYGRHSIDDQDIEAVVKVLRSDWLTQGPAVQEFEAAIAAFCKAPHAVSACNATAALHLACLSLGIGPGDLVWTSPISFVASANCALYCGADVDFVDIDSQTFNLSVTALERKLEFARLANRLPRAVIVVHLAGQSADLKSISVLAKKYGFSVIEDASHAIGGTYLGEPIGSCTYSDLAVFSFHPVKIITTGEGGAITTRRSDLAQKLIQLRSHGITRDPVLLEEAAPGPWYYEQQMLGFNYRLTDLHATLGTSQLRRIHDFVERRHALAARYNRLLNDLPVTVPWQDGQGKSAFHLYVIQLKINPNVKSQRQIFEEMRARGIEVNLHYIPIHLQPYYQRLGFRAGDFPAAERYYSQAMSLPLFPTLSEADQDRVVEALRSCLV